MGIDTATDVCVYWVNGDETNIADPTDFMFEGIEVLRQVEQPAAIGANTVLHGLDDMDFGPVGAGRRETRNYRIGRAIFSRKDDTVFLWCPSFVTWPSAASAEHASNE